MNTIPSHDEKKLVKLVAKGNELAFAQIFNHYRPIIYTNVLRLSASTIIAEEIVQDVFLKAWLKRQELPDIDNLGGWLYTIASRLTYNALKQQQRDLKRMSQEDLDENHLNISTDFHYQSTEMMLLDNKKTDLLQKAIDSLPQKQKEVFKLVRQQGLKRADAAVVLNISPETVKSNLSEAMIKIRAFVKSNPVLWFLYLSNFIFEK